MSSLLRSASYCQLNEQHPLRQRRPTSWSPAGRPLPRRRLGARHKCRHTRRRTQRRTHPAGYGQPGAQRRYTDCYRLVLGRGVLTPTPGRTVGSAPPFPLALTCRPAGRAGLRPALACRGRARTARHTPLRASTVLRIPLKGPCPAHLKAF